MQLRQGTPERNGRLEASDNKQTRRRRTHERRSGDKRFYLRNGHSFPSLRKKKAERGRQNTHHSDGLSVEGHSAADQVRISVKLTREKPVGQYDRTWRLVRLEQTSANRLGTRHHPEIAGNRSNPHPVGRVGCRKRGVAVIITGHPVKGLGLCSPLGKVRSGESRLKVFRTGSGDPVRERNEAVGLGIRERAEENRADDTKYRRVDANAKRQRESRDGRKS